MTENKTNYRSLALAAIEAMKKSYSPYSNFTVGAALLTKEGKIYTGANIENASYTPTVCAERVAIFSAVHAGEREFSAIAIAGGRAGESGKDAFMPCGVCRQVISEFADKDFVIITALGDSYEAHTLSELLPHSFTKEKL